MPTYIVAAELNGHGERNQEFEAALAALEAVPSLQSVWFVYSQDPCECLRDALEPHLRQGETLFVGTLSGAWTSAGTAELPARWLNSHLSG